MRGPRPTRSDAGRAVSRAWSDILHAPVPPSSPTFIVREAVERDHAPVAQVLQLAFGGSQEAELVAALREANALSILLVALSNDTKVVGCVALSSVSTPDCASATAGLGLAPLAVTPAHQRKGLGHALMHRALELARERGAGFVVLLGSPAYYARFGFRAASTWGLRCVYDAPAEAFQALELEPGALSHTRGIVRYHAAFERFE